MHTKKIMIISHRGTPTVYPEHSFEGYDNAIVLGTNYLEQDLQLTKDGVLVVSHDKHVGRMTAGQGIISEMTSKEVQACTFANGESIHTLAEIFERYQQTKNYVIETKFDYADSGDYRGEDSLLALIKAYGVEQQIVFQSFHLASLAYLTKHLPQAPALLLIKESKNKGIENEDLSLYPHLDIFCFEYNLLTATIVKKIHQAGKEVFIYFEEGDDTEAHLKAALKLNIDGVFTDYTDRAIKIIGLDAYR